MIRSLLDTTEFTKIYSVEHELKKAAVLRIFLGIIVFVRYWEIYYSMSIYNPGMLFMQSIVLLVIIGLFTVGILTPVVTIALAIAINWFDGISGTRTLGTNILTQLLMAMFLMNHGLYGSFDSWVMQSKNKYSQLTKYMYNILGRPTKESIRVAYFLGFLFYAFTSLGALILHIKDPYWVQGLTLYSALTNSYIFKYYEVTRYIELLIPNALFVLSVIGTVMQSVFQFLMIPLMFFSWGRKYVVIWGMVFFFISLIGINLSYLPHVEIIFWLLIFFSVKTNTKKVKIIYDDHCNLCTKGMQFFKALNFNGRYEFIALSKNKALYEMEGLTEKEVRTYMVGWLDGKKYVGYELYIMIFKANVLLLIFLPFLYIGKIGNIGSKLYNYIAERRYKIFGVCQISSQDVMIRQFDLGSLKERRSVLSFLYILFLSVLFLFIIIRYPVGLKEYMGKNFIHTVSPIMYKFGLDIPNVFNKTDLSMGDHWLVIHRQELNKTFNLVPITALDGSRMTYECLDILNFSNHNSDFFYFGNTLPYRRKMIHVANDDLIEFHTNGYGFQNIKKRIQYDYKKKDLNESIMYKIDVYKNRSSHVQQWKTDLNRYIPEKIYQALYIYDGTDLKIVLQG